MSTYIYLPVDTEEMRKLGEDWTSGQKEKGKTPYEILTRSHTLKNGFGLFGNALRKVTNSDKLYILAHGYMHRHNSGAVSIGARVGARETRMENGLTRWQGGKDKQYEPAALAQLLKKEGLPLNFFDLRVFSCGSGLSPDSGEITVSFAQRLADELRNIGYMNISVTGYQGTLQAAYGTRYLNEDEFSSEQHKGILMNGQYKRASLGHIVFTRL